MDKYNQLKSYKWIFAHYYIEIPYDNLDLYINIHKYKVTRIDQNTISFYCNKKLKDNIDGIVINRYNKFFIYFRKKYLISFISFLIIISLIILSNIFIHNIVFKDPIEYQQAVYDDVYQSLNKLGPFYTLKEELNEITHQLQKKYYYYAYIGVTKIGSNIVIDIEYINSKDYDNNNNDEIDNTPGDLIASYDGYITGMSIEKGQSIVAINQTVKKGEVLVSGNLLLSLNQINKDQYIKAKGIVLAQIGYYKIVTIDKKITNEVYSGSINEKYLIRINKKNINKYQYKYDRSFIKEREVFDIKGFFTIVKVTEYEKIKSVYEYDYESALAYSHSLIERDFNHDKKHYQEEIINCKLIKMDENNNQYVFKFFILANKNIAIFNKFN